MEQEKILDMAVSAGSILLRFGAETYRVEDTIDRICKSYGLICQAFVLPTGIIVSVEGNQGVSTICKRIPSRSVDLTKISYLNDLSRRIEKNTPSYEEVMNELSKILECKKYSNITIVICYALTAFVYVLIFGGSLYDAISVLPVGTILGLMKPIFSKGSSFPFIEYFVGGFIAGLFSLTVGILFSQTNPYIILIGAVINMVPGVALTNGIRDLLHGDSVSGLARLGEALMVVAVIAAGTGIGLSIWFMGGKI